MSLSETDTATSEETLHIQNFAGITDATITLSRMNVFIGPQASGKSVCAKLIFYFRQIVLSLTSDIFLYETAAEISRKSVYSFNRYFPNENTENGSFLVRYDFGKVSFSVSRDSNNISTMDISCSEYWQALTLSAQKTTDAGIPATFNSPPTKFRYPGTTYVNEKLKDDIGATLNNSADFIAAGRTFFATFDTVNYILQAEGVEIDPFLIEFGKLYQKADNSLRNALSPAQSRDTRLLPRVESILYGEYFIESGRRYILSRDGRKVRLENSSSGQQEAAPLTVILEHIGNDKSKAQSTTLFVEEPEAHLYPDAQREMVHLLCTALDLTSPESSSQCVITTHSPYILTALNNLMYGASLTRNQPEHERQVRDILGDTGMVAPEHVRAYAFSGGNITSIIDSETKLVLARELDSVSGKLACEFRDLMDIEFENQEDN